MALYRGSDTVGDPSTTFSPMYRGTFGWCGGFSGLLCLDGSDASAWGVGTTGGTVTSDVIEFTANMSGDYAGYLEFATEIGETYAITLELTELLSDYFYAEIYDTSWTKKANVEPMNNERPSGPEVVSGTFVAVDSTSRFLLGEEGGDTFTFKNIKVEKQ